MRIVKWLLLFVIGVVVLLGAGVAGLMFFVDPQQYKEQVVQWVKQETGRDLKMEGPIGLTFFPWAGIVVSGVEMSNPAGFGSAPFVKAERVELRVKLIPLLEKKVEIDRILLQGMRLQLEKNAQGKVNWDFAQASQKSAQPFSEVTPAGKSSQPTDTTAKKTPTGVAKESSASLSQVAMAPLSMLTVGGIEIKESTIVWHDQSKGEQIAVENLFFTSGPLAMGEKMDLDVQCHVVHNKPKMGMDVEAGSTIILEANGKKVQFGGSHVHVLAKGEGLPEGQGEVNMTFAGQFDVDSGLLTLKGLKLKGSSGKAGDAATMVVELTSDALLNLMQNNGVLEGAEMVAHWRGKGAPEGGVEATLLSKIEYDLNKEIVRISGFQATLLNQYKLNGSLTGEQIFKDSQLTGSVRMESVNVREVMQRLRLSTVVTQDEKVLAKAAFASGLVVSSKGVELKDLDLSLDDTRIQGSWGIRLKGRPATHFDLAVNAINIDRYMPPSSKEGAHKPTAAATAKQEKTPTKPAQEGQALGGLFAMADKMDVDGKIRFGQLVIFGAQLANVNATMQGKNGRLRLEPVTAALYQGNMNTRLDLQSRTAPPSLAVVSTLNGVNVAPMLKDVANNETLEGILDFNVDIQGAGASQASFMRSLAGNSRFEVKKGVLNGINIVQTIRSAKALVRQEESPTTSGPQRTEFTNLAGSALIRQGVVENKDLKATAQGLQITGEGTANLVAQQLDYLLNAKVTESLKGLGDLEKLKGMTIPIALSGPFSDIQVDKSRIGLALAKEAGKKYVDDKLEKKINEKYGDKLQQVLGKEGAKEAPKVLKEGLKSILGR